ncbi:MAG TPA: GspH/FimT family pseudopilin [Solimonas sp.]|nr:GspH/FimT family pseudopilin [Solimonas sp.]
MRGEHRIVARATAQRRPRGFSLIELMVTVGIAAIVAMVTVPGLQSLVQNNRTATQVNALVSALMYARNEAVTRGGRVSICTSSDGYTCSDTDSWSGGWIVFSDTAGARGIVDPLTSDQVLQVFEALDGGSQLTGTTRLLSYDSAGFLTDALAPSFSYRGASCTPRTARTINLSLQGRANVQPATC